MCSYRSFTKNRIARLFPIALFLITATWTLPVLANAADYYVRPSEGEYGSEDGTSYAHAFDGFSDINWSAVDSGNGRLFVCGTFTAEQLIIGASGENGMPLGVVSCTKANGASVDDRGIVDGKGTSGLSSGEGLVDAVGLSYILIDGLEVSNSPQTLVRMKSCTNSIIQNSKVHDNENADYVYAHGINLKYSRHCQVSGNEVYASNRNAIVVEGAEYNLIEGNYVHDNPAHNCLDFKEGDGGTTLQSGNVVRYNTFTGCSNGILSAFQSNQLIHSNLIYKNAKSAMWFINTGSPAQTYVANSKIYNNTCVNNNWDGIQNQYAKNLTIKNNIFSNGRREISISSAANQGHIIENNLYGSGSQWLASGSSYSTLSVWQSAEKYDYNSMVVNPVFKDSGSNDYSLKSISPAIDAGINLSSESVQYDIKRESRPQGSGFDIGAYEFTNEQSVDPNPPVNLRIAQGN